MVEFVKDATYEVAKSLPVSFKAESMNKVHYRLKGCSEY